MSNLDDVLGGIKTVTELAANGGIDDAAAKAKIVEVLVLLHASLGVAELFSFGTAKTVEAVADEIIATLVAEPPKQEG